MYKIKKIPVDSADKLEIKNKLWGYDEYDSSVYAQLVYDDEGIIVKFSVFEKKSFKRKK